MSLLRIMKDNKKYFPLIWSHYSGSYEEFYNLTQLSKVDIALKVWQQNKQFSERVVFQDTVFFILERNSTSFHFDNIQLWKSQIRNERRNSNGFSHWGALVHCKFLTVHWIWSNLLSAHWLCISECWIEFKVLGIDRK